MFKWLLHKLKGFTPPSPLTLEEIKKKRPQIIPAPPPPKELQKVVFHVYHHKMN